MMLPFLCPFSLRSKYDKANKAAGADAGPAVDLQDVEEDIDPNKLGALAMEAMLSQELG